MRLSKYRNVKSNDLFIFQRHVKTVWRNLSLEETINCCIIFMFKTSRLILICITGSFNLYISPFCLFKGKKQATG